MKDHAIRFEEWIQRILPKHSRSERKSDLKFIFVHGLSGWGSYDKVNTFFPYWGTSHGDMIKYLRTLGYDAYSASVAPKYSAWDRACELYAQLAGKQVDYGEEHSKRCNHVRFGRDFSSCPLIEDFESSTIVLIGHSFGGATVRLFQEILRNGWKAEKNTEQENLSDFFKGNTCTRVHAVITLAAPTNGTTSYDLYEDENFDVHSIDIPEKYWRRGELVGAVNRGKFDDRIKEDYAAYDMHIDNAQALNEKISTFEDVYYFAVPFASGDRNEKGEFIPDPAITESMFMKSAMLMSAYKGVTANGLIIDETWQQNDGLVNTISSMAPFNAPAEQFTSAENLHKGVWTVMPVIRGDHMSVQGGMTKRRKVKAFYRELAELISTLE